VSLQVYRFTGQAACQNVRLLGPGRRPAQTILCAYCANSAYTRFRVRQNQACMNVQAVYILTQLLAETTKYGAHIRCTHTVLADTLSSLTRATYSTCTRTYKRAHQIKLPSLHCAHARDPKLCAHPTCSHTDTHTHAHTLMHACIFSQHIRPACAHTTFAHRMSMRACMHARTHSQLPNPTLDIEVTPQGAEVAA